MVVAEKKNGYLALQKPGFDILIAQLALRALVVGARPGSRTPRLLITVDNGNNRPVRASNHQKGSSQDNEDTPPDHHRPLGGSVVFALAPVVVQPHAGHRLETHRGTKQGTNQRDKVTKYGNRTGNDIGYHRGAAGAADPNGPVDDGIGYQMPGAVEDADENVLGRDLRYVSTDIAMSSSERYLRGRKVVY